jgi:hypothetical protein
MKFLISHLLSWASSVKHLEQFPGKISLPLLNGIRTFLLRFTGVRHPGDPSSRTLEAQLCLFQEVNQMVRLMVHPPNHHSSTKQDNDRITSNILNQQMTQKSSPDAKNSSSIQSDVRIKVNSYLGSTGSVDSVDRHRFADIHNTKCISDSKSGITFYHGIQDATTVNQSIIHLFRNYSSIPMPGTVILF